MMNDRDLIQEAIQRISIRENLTAEMTEAVMDLILQGRASELHCAAFLSALSTKGETVDEICGAVSSLRSHYKSPFHGINALEIAGTGGDGLHSFNISTCAAFVAASTGIPVIKHGNRAATSRSGSADVLESLGVNIRVSPEQSRQVLNRTGMCFLFNQDFPEPMKRVSHLRRELGIVTVLNKVRWVSTARAQMELLGVYQKELAQQLAYSLAKTGTQHAMVVHGMDGMDEVSPCNDTLVFEIHNGQVRQDRISPRSLGIPLCSIQDLTGGSPDENAMIIRRILDNQDMGHKRWAVLLNAAAAIRVANSEMTWADAVGVADEAIVSGKAARQLEKLVSETNAPAQ